MMYMKIGSGDIKDLLAKFDTKAYRGLWDKFMSNNPPVYNAIRSPIDQLRTGAILEDVYYKRLIEDFLPQYKVTSSDMDCLTVTLDFANLENGKVIEFEELKSVDFDKFIELEKLKQSSTDAYTLYLKKYYKIYYNQIQSQLYATGLDKCTLTFVVVYEYDDEINSNRILSDKEYIKFNIKRDEEVINLIKYRLTPFQKFKDFHTKL